MKKFLEAWAKRQIVGLQIYGIFVLLGWGIALRLGALKLNWSFSILRLWIEVLATSNPF